ncbi:anthrone oxygenase family protein [Arthrobacter sp. ERGS1:01]|uniref:anthrone oxygenase family protein n=1 Tax=Arthrobacter sp. ERGS1:01 TaxID=1704044 RepID=UPI0006B4F4C0|nr:anthrone oxygenase family protein [Arthrobacter sp. ERGS1:01]
MLYPGIIRLLALATMGILAGAYVDGALVLVPAQNRLSASAYIESEQANTALGTIRYRILVFAAIGTGTLLAISFATQPAQFALSILAIALIAAATVLTIARVVPINRTVHNWEAGAPPSNWADIRRQWHRLHYIRTAMVLAAMLLQLAAVVGALP